jgi:DNA-binding NtrC family response regulator
MAARLLYVDDETDLRELVSIQLMVEGYDVRIASNGEEAFEILQSESFDLVLMDVWMPRMNGVETLKALHELDIHPRTIMLTGDEDIAVLTACARLGISDFLLKPYDYQDLMDSITRMLACEEDSRVDVPRP